MKSHQACLWSTKYAIDVSLLLAGGGSGEEKGGKKIRLSAVTDGEVKLRVVGLILSVFRFATLYDSTIS